MPQFQWPCVFPQNNSSFPTAVLPEIKVIAVFRGLAIIVSLQTKTSSSRSGVVLEKGQVWQLPFGRAQVISLGRTLVHFKFRKTGQSRAGGIELKSIRSFMDALKKNEAKLTKDSSLFDGI